MTRMVETLHWIHAGRELPDADITVLLNMPLNAEPVWPGYWNGEHWMLADGMFAVGVEAWADFPAGPQPTLVEVPRK